MFIYNSYPTVFMKGNVQPIEWPRPNSTIPLNLLNNFTTTCHPGLKLKIEIKEIMENQKLTSKKKHKNN